MTPTVTRTIGSHRLRAMLLSVVLVGSLFVPTVALAASPTVTINQAAAQPDPTNSAPVNFTVVFSESVTGFATGDVTLSGGAGATTATVTGSGSTYNVAVTGMTTSGTVIATVPAGVATNSGAEANVASTSTDNTVTWDLTAPSVTIDQAGGQPDPTGTSPINFTVVFSESVTGFATGDVTLGGTAGGTLTGTVTGGGTTYNVAVTGMTTAGTIIASIGAGIATDLVGNANLASSSIDGTVTWAPGGPTVTINQAAAQPDPTNSSPVNFTVVFSASVTGFATGDVTLGGTAGATTATVTGSGTTYNVAVTGMTTSGTVTATIGAAVAIDGSSRPNVASTSADNTVTWDVTRPSVTIDQAVGQPDPTGTSPINFTVVFSESVTGFATGDVTLGGTAGATTGTVSGSGTTYNVAVTGMTTAGSVIASIGVNKAVDAAGNQNLASTSSDDTVTWAPGGPTLTINQAVGQADPTSASPINFTVVFSASVTGFATGDVSLSGTAGGALVGTVTGSGTTYNVAVTGMTTSGTVIATIAQSVAIDGSSRPNFASTSSDNIVTWASGPTVTINQAVGQADPTGTSPINFTVVFSASVTGFATGDVTLSGGTAGGTLVGTVTGSGTTYNVAVTGMTTAGTVIATVPAGVAVDTSARPNVTSTSTDNTVTWTPGQGVTINQATGQADPTATSPINFTVVFSSSVTGFATGDVTISGTAGGTKTATVTGSGTTYNVAVTGMTTAGTVIATVPAGVAVDASARPNLASTSTDNTVTWTPVATSITLTTSAPTSPGGWPTITWGGGIILTTQFGTNGGNKTFKMQATRDNVIWFDIGPLLTTDTAGRNVFVFRPSTNYFYRAVFAGTPDLLAGTSNSVRTVVRQIAILRPTNQGAVKSISRNTSITFYTVVRPSRPELTPAKVTFSFYRLSGSRWVLSTRRTVTATADGRAATTFRFSSSGQWYVRSMANPTTYNANSVMSSIERYSVR